LLNIIFAIYKLFNVENNKELLLFIIYYLNLCVNDVLFEDVWLKDKDVLYKYVLFDDVWPKVVLFDDVWFKDVFCKDVLFKNVWFKDVLYKYVIFEDCCILSCVVA